MPIELCIKRIYRSHLKWLYFLLIIQNIDTFSRGNVKQQLDALIIQFAYNEQMSFAICIYSCFELVEWSPYKKTCTVCQYFSNVWLHVCFFFSLPQKQSQPSLLHFKIVFFLMNINTNTEYSTSIHSLIFRMSHSGEWEIARKMLSPLRAVHERKNNDMIWLYLKHNCCKFSKCYAGGLLESIWSGTVAIERWTQ